jgi:O-antigen ligase
MPFRILVALGFEVVAAVGTVVMPYLGFLFFLAWTILRPQDDRPNVAELHYPMVLLLSVLLGTVPKMAKDQGFSILHAVRRLYLILLFFFLMFVSAVATGYTPHSSYRVNEFFVVVLTCIMLVYWGSSESRIWGIMASFVVAGLQISRDALTRTSWMREQIGGQSFDRMNMNRLNGNFGSPNYIGLLMSVLILICLNFLYTRYSKWLKLAACGAIGVFFYVFLKANSRGASLGLAAALFAFLLFQKRKAVTLAMLAIVLIGVLSFAPQAYFDRLKTIVSYEQDASATGRLELWQIGLTLIRNHPLFGVGPDNFMDYAFNGPHDCYIQAAAEMGIPAAIVYCAILISGFIAGISALRLSRKLPDGDNLSALAVAVLCLLAHITVQGFTTGFAHREFVYFFITCTQCTYLVARERTKQMAPIGPSPATPFARPSRDSGNVLPPLSYGSG